MSSSIPAQKEIWGHFLEQYIHTFLEPLFAEAHLISAARHAIKRYIRKRQQHNSAYRDMMAAKDAVVKEQTAAAVAGNDTASSGSGRTKKEEALERAQFRYRIVKEEFEDFAAKLITECDNFKTQRSYALRKLLHQYLSLEIQLAESLQGAWTSSLEAFAQSPVEQSAVPVHAVSD